MSTPQWPRRDESGGQSTPGGPREPGSPPAAPYPAGGHYPPPAGPSGYSHNNYASSNQGYDQNSYGHIGYSQSADQTIYAPESFSAQSASHQSYPSAGFAATGVPGGPSPIIGGSLLFLAGLAAAVVAGLIWLDVGAYDFAPAVFGLGIPVLIKTAIDLNIIFIASIVIGLLTAVFSIMLIRRVRAVRIPLAILGIIGTAYYAYQLVYHLTDEIASVYQPTSQLVVEIVVLATWLMGTIVTLLPTTAGATK